MGTHRSHCRGGDRPANLGFVPIHSELLQMAYARLVCIRVIRLLLQAQPCGGSARDFYPEFSREPGVSRGDGGNPGYDHISVHVFRQSNQEVEEEIAAGRKTLVQRRGATDTELEYAALDVNLGMLFSNTVMYFIILSTAATLFKMGKNDIQSAAEAAQALRPVAGRAAEALLALGLIGTGFLAVPILTGSSAYAVAEAFGWRHGFDKNPHRAKEFYGLIAVSTLLGMMINFAGINPIKALFLTAVLNGLLAPPLLVLILQVSNNRKILGDRVNGPLLNVAGWVTAGVMSAAAVALLVTWGQ
jgi:Mn2+/Fe2+ NRAMP family transporter